jgi:hypothetical protein
MPDQRAVRFEDARELRDYARIIRRVSEEAERSEEIEHSIEPTSPFRGHPAHVTTCVLKRTAGSSFSCYRQKIPRVVEAINVETRFSEKMGVAALTTGNVEDSGSGR